MNKPKKEIICEFLKMGNGATARMHFDFWSDFAINVLQNFLWVLENGTVQVL